MTIGTLGLDNMGLSEEQQDPSTQALAPLMPQRKRARGPSTSQSVEDESAWVG